MDVIIERRKDGNRFKMEIWFFSTVLEIKEKIHKYHGVPVDKQMLYIRGAAMENDRDTVYYELVEGSKIDLVVIDEDEEEKQEIVMVGGGTDDDDHDEDDEGENKKRKKQKGIRFKIKVSVPAMRRWITMDVEGGETVAQLKEMIGIEGLAVGRMALMVGGVEMQDPQRALREYGVVEGTEVSVVVRSAAGVTTAAAVGKRITVMVLVKGVTKKMGVEVNVMESVRELRKELERLERLERLQRLVLPTEGYFFIYKQEVMEEERSFRWHGVKNNDTIEVFNGSVTGGS